MINACPHCQAALQFNPAQQEKIKAALASMTTSTLKLGCPHCKKTIILQADGNLYDEATAAKKLTNSTGAPPVAPPAFPDISWLAQGIYTEKETVSDVPKALVLMAEGKGREAVLKAFRERGYVVDLPESAADGLTLMRFSPFAAVVLHVDFDGSLAESTFHQQMATMPMDKRRSLFYALIGKEFHTLYHLEALTHSANVVVNETEVIHFDIILKKGLQEQQELFGPFADALRTASKKS